MFSTNTNRAFVLLLLLAVQLPLFAQRVDPPCWWAGMKNDLQLMVRGQNLQNSTVTVLEDGLSVKNVYNADSPDYLFIDMEVQRAGSYTIEISQGAQSAQGAQGAQGAPGAPGMKKIKIPYQILPRTENSAQRSGFTNADAIYLIMPDRFADGDTTNNFGKIDRTHLEARHGGDIQGIINHLDYLQDLGVTAIWATPMLDDDLSYHNYGITDYYKINPYFGTNELYKEMVQLAHEKGLKIIQDVTPQHCGVGHAWVKNPPFRDWLNDTNLPPHYEYFSLEALSDPHSSKIDRDFTGNTIIYKQMPDMNMRNPFVLKYIAQYVIWWIEYANLDGLRVDTYFYMGLEAAKWTKLIRDEFPNMGIVGEIWGNEPSILARWLSSDSLPMVMDFPLQEALVIDLTKENAHWGGKMRTVYNALALDFVYDNPEKSQVVFADNHDMMRLYNMLKKDSSLVKIAMTFIATTRGLPQIYYGTEWLFADDSRGGPHANRVDFHIPSEPAAAQQDVFKHLRTLLNFRKQTPVLQGGKLMQYIPSGGVYTYFRYDENDCVMIIINASDKVQSIEWARFDERLNGKTAGIDILTGKTITNGEETEVAARSSLVIKF
ncbi:MAG: cyclomaltodextrinase C-terminal domain-containing protein [Bacteroidales bacterium]|jgi:glycosidase|nr:cyclomaltodextrinase C-terminal domain-containing protein [Bacteroidales bacterium]